LLLASVEPVAAASVMSTMALYLFTLLIIFCQTTLGIRYRVSRSRLLLLANLELVTVLALLTFFFPLGIESATWRALAFIFLYFLGLAIISRHQIRLLFPFTLPFLFFCVFTDLAAPLWSVVIFTLFLLMMIPPLMVFF